jgi:hypothetical protein
MYRPRREAPRITICVWTVTAHWLKLKNPNSAAVRREAEEEWG